MHAGAGYQDTAHELHTEHTTTEAVEKFTKGLQQVPILEMTIGADSDSEEDSREVRKKIRPLQSGKLRRADSMVIHKAMCPHELVYTAAGHPAVYDKLSIVLFVSGLITWQ